MKMVKVSDQVWDKYFRLEVEFRDGRTRRAIGGTPQMSIKNFLQLLRFEHGITLEEREELTIQLLELSDKLELQETDVYPEEKV